MLGEYGIGKVAVEDTGFAVRMNVFRSNSESKRGNPAAGDSAEAPTGASNNSGTEKIKDGRPIKRPIKRPLKDHVLETIREKPGITRPQLVSIVGKGRTVVTEALASLQKAGLIEHRGSKKTGGYHCKE